MKRLLISMKLSTGAHLQELDVLEKNYTDFFGRHGFLVLPLPNNTSQVIDHIKNADCIVLSGGSDTIDSDTRRNLTETSVLREAIARDIPVLGICRGMQFINHYFRGKDREAPKIHSEGEHEIMITDENPPIEVKDTSGVVSSFHYRCVMPEDLASGLKIFALSEDGVVEGLYHEKLKIIGVQWHPERLDSKWIDNGLIKWISITDF